MPTTTPTGYDTEFIVKYKQIYDDLLVKLAEETDPGYTQEDAETLVDELYRHELLSVFGCDAIDEDKIVEIVGDVWDRIKEYAPFYSIFYRFLEKRFPDDLEQIESVDQSILFTALFSFDWFYLVHPCLCEFLTTGDISSSVLDAWRGCVESLS